MRHALACYTLVASSLFSQSFYLSSDVIPRKETVLLTIDPARETFEGRVSIDVELRGSRETLGYAATTFQPARTDYADMLAGGLIIRMSMQTRIGFYYEDQRRLSSEGLQFEYGRRRMYTSVTYGF